MNRCASVRKKGSRDQCPTHAMKGHRLCGRHARMKSPVLWTSLHTTSPVVRLQALVRGFLLRKRLALAGPGVLHRADLANDEDVFTCESKVRQHPMEYFSFEEGGKLWWFDVGSLWTWSARSLEPVNPYTKTPLTLDTRKRLRAIWGHAYRMRLIFPLGGKTFDEILTLRWNVLSQIFRDNGFLDVHPQSFLRFSRAEYGAMFALLHQDLLVVLSERDPCRDKILRLCRRGMSIRPAVGNEAYILHSGLLLLLMLSVPKDPYVLVFSILSAFFRC